MSTVLIFQFSVPTNLCVASVPPLTIAPLDILHSFLFCMYLFVSAFNCGTESSNDHYQLLNFVSTTAVFPCSFCLESLFCNMTCVCCCRYLKFICAGSTTLIGRNCCGKKKSWEENVARKSRNFRNFFFFNNVIFHNSQLFLPQQYNFSQFASFSSRNLYSKGSNRRPMA